ncbi:MAG: SpoIIE family protein phosphatase [Nitrospinae bacterium]|nr:SpoIIE family protein phosphatase [Nitrospinota bacterium]
MEEPHRILVVDDEPDLEQLVLQRMRREIRRGRYSFVFARNGVEALERLNENGGDPIDMVLTDINMPEMDGLTLLKQIPSVDPNVRSVVVSAYGDMKNIRTAMNRGAFDFVTKPIDFEDLRITIDRTLEHLAMLREALEARDKLVALRSDLDLASKMQQSILPTKFPESPDYEIYAGMVPARDVGGDFFDVINLGDDRIGITVADVSGKGVPAALFMMSSRTLLNSVAVARANPGEVLGEVNRLLRPGDVLSEVNRLLQENNEAAMFVTVFFAFFESKTGDMVYANGGHNPPVIIHADGSSSLLAQQPGVALGIAPEFSYDMYNATLAPGEALILYTDGVTEAENVKTEQFGLDRLLGILGGASPSSAKEINDKIFDAVKEFAGRAPQFDDITCLTLYRRGGSE